MSDRIIEHPNELPSAYRYVVMRDTYLSDWGRAEDKDSIHVYPCNSHAEAEVVKANAEARSDQDRISIQPGDYFTGAMSEFPDGWVVSLCTRESSARWFEPDAFSRNGGFNTPTTSRRVTQFTPDDGYVFFHHRKQLTLHGQTGSAENIRLPVDHDARQEDD